MFVESINKLLSGYTLHFPVGHGAFDAFKRGFKHVEYRVSSPFWNKRAASLIAVGSKVNVVVYKGNVCDKALGCLRGHLLSISTFHVRSGVFRCGPYLNGYTKLLRAGHLHAFHVCLR